MTTATDKSVNGAQRKLNRCPRLVSKDQNWDRNPEFLHV